MREAKKIFSLLGLVYCWSLFAQSAPEISCVPSAFSNPIIRWTEANDVCGSYTLYVSTNGGPFISLATFPSGSTNNYQHVGADGINNTLSYYLQCDADANLISDTVSNERMINPKITAVTMNSNTQVQIDWEEGISPTTDIYRVYESINGSVIATQRGADIIGKSNTTFTYNYPYPIKTPLTYIVTALNSCGQNEDLPTPPNGYHSSIFLSLETDRCNAALNLEWTPYQGWDSVEYYEIHFQNITSGNNQSIQVGNDTLSYELSNIIDEDEYNIQIHARSNDGTLSYSNDTNLTINIVSQPSFVYLANTSVHDDGVELTYYTDKTADIRRFEVHRKTGTNNWEKLWEEKVPLPQGVSPLDMQGRLAIPIVRKDKTARTGKLAYEYEVRALDSCFQAFPSNIGTAMLLEGNAQYDYINAMHWNPYLDWDNGVQDYEIYKQVDTTSIWNPLGTALTPLYEDDIESETMDVFSRDRDGIFCYQVKATNTPTARDIAYGLDSIESLSSKLCLVQWPPFLSGIPNAFSPNMDGLNDEFKPNMVFVREEGYSMRIMDRWGKVVFESSHPDDGWDGRIRGENSPQGIYVYKIVMFLPDPNEPETLIEKVLTGSLMLMR